MSILTKKRINILNLIYHESIRSLYRNKLRSALSVIGITIGIGAVVSVVAIGRAGSQRALQQLQNLGDNLVWIEAGSRNINGVRSGSRGMNSLTMEDDKAIFIGVPSIKRISPNVDGSILTAWRNNNWTTHYRGVTPEFLEIRRWNIAEGNSFTDEDVKYSANVCMIGQTVLMELFKGEDAIGQDIRINKQIFKVIGILASKGQSGGGQDQDDTIILPYTTVQKKIRGKGFTWLDDIMVSLVSLDSSKASIDQITELLRQRHHITIRDNDDFNIRHPEDIINAQIAANHTLAFFLISVASISLLVGGIGIMNVMLVSVTERTKEIGLRLAVGATIWAIHIQFLSEAVMLSLLGGIIGVLLGMAGSFVFGYILGWQISIPLNALIIAPICAIGTGIFFGFYPAWKAALLDPITALRHE